MANKLGGKVMEPVCDCGSWIFTWPTRCPPPISHDSNASLSTLYKVTIWWPVSDAVVVGGVVGGTVVATSAGVVVAGRTVFFACCASCWAIRRIRSATTLLFWMGNGVETVPTGIETETAWRGYRFRRTSPEAELTDGGEDSTTVIKIEKVIKKIAIFKTTTTAAMRIRFNLERKSVAGHLKERLME